MNLVHELEVILQQPNFMGGDITGCNLAVNQILDRIEELGFEVVEKVEDKRTITINFKNIISELELKNLRLCFIKDRGLFIQDSRNNIYQTERVLYLDKLIKDGITVEFNQVNSVISQNIEDWKKEIWDVKDVEKFIERHLLTA